MIKLCSKCGSTALENISDMSYEIIMCRTCGHHEILGDAFITFTPKIEKKIDVEKAWEYTNKIKTCLEALYEILEISYSEDSIFFLCGLDNLIALRDGIIDLMSNEYTTKEMRLKLRDIEFEIKKNIFFNNCQKKITTK